MSKNKKHTTGNILAAAWKKSNISEAKQKITSKYLKT